MCPGRDEKLIRQWAQERELGDLRIEWYQEFLVEAIRMKMEEDDRVASQIGEEEMISRMIADEKQLRSVGEMKQVCG